MLYLHGIGHFHPATEITNQFLEDLDIGTNEAWIMERVGIRTRRTLLSLDYIRTTRNLDHRAAPEAMVMTNAQMGACAAQHALARAGLPAEAIGMVICGSCAPDTVTPAEACNIACELHLEVPAFDVNSACTSLFAATYLLSMMQADRLPPYVLIVLSEPLTGVVNYNDRSAAVLWGDGAAACVVSTTVPARARILGNRLASNPAGANKVVVPRTGLFDQEGRTVQMFAIKKTVQVLQQLSSEYTQADRELHFIGHQANMRMLEAVCRQTRFPDARHHSNAECFGNTAAAGSPAVLSMNWERWTDRMDVAVVGVGAGLTWGGFLLRFADSLGGA